MGSVKIKKVNIYSLLGIVILLVVWESAAYMVQWENPQMGKTILPTIKQVLTIDLPSMSAFYGIGMGGKYGQEFSYGRAFLVIMYHTSITLYRLLLGTLIGMLFGITFGLIMSMNKIFLLITELPVLLIRSIPILTLIPLFVGWFGGSEIGIILYVAFAVFAMIVINTMEAIRNVNPVYVQYAKTMGANQKQIFRTIIIPAIVPELVGGIRVVLGLSWAITLAGEYLGAQSGLGRILIVSENFLYTGRMIIVVILFMLYSVILNKFFQLLGNYLIRWMPKT